MSKNLWLPFWINIALLACAVPTISTLPTFYQATSITSIERIDRSLGEAGPLLEERDSSSELYVKAFEVRPGILQSVPHAVRKMGRLVTGRRNFQVLLCSFFLTALASSDTKLLVQYISARYEWTFAEVSFITA